jgi:hypothetical protein
LTSTGRPSSYIDYSRTSRISCIRSRVPCNISEATHVWTMVRDGEDDGEVEERNPNVVFLVRLAPCRQQHPARSGNPRAVSTSQLPLGPGLIRIGPVKLPHKPVGSASPALAGMLWLIFAALWASLLQSASGLFLQSP